MALAQDSLSSAERLSSSLATFRSVVLMQAHLLVCSPSACAIFRCRARRRGAGLGLLHPGAGATA